MRPLVSSGVAELRRSKSLCSSDPYSKSTDRKPTTYIKEIGIPSDDPEKYQMLVNMPSIRSLAEMEAARTRVKGEAEVPFSPEEVSPTFARAELSASREIPRNYDYQAAAMAQNLI